MAFDKLSAAQIATLIQKVITTAASTNITGATNATPIVVASAANGLAVGDWALVMGVGGNTAANGVFQISVVPDSGHATLAGSVGNSNYTSGGTIAKLTLSQWAGDLTVDQLRQLLDAASRMASAPANTLVAQFPANVQP